VDHGDHMAHMAQGVDHGQPAPHAAHDRHAGHTVAAFRDKFWLSLVLTIPVIVWSRDPQEWPGLCT
jgi:Cu2+-exporting ATPase